jgi:hypothetical protein
MTMQVDDPGRDDQSGRIQHLLGVTALEMANLGDLTILDAEMPTSALYGGNPVPSTIVPPLISLSNSAMASSRFAFEILNL